MQCAQGQKFLISSLKEAGTSRHTDPGTPGNTT